MKLRNKILAMAVVAVAGISAYIANDTKSTNLSDLQLKNVEMLAEAQEPGGPSYCFGTRSWCYAEGRPGVHSFFDAN